MKLADSAENTKRTQLCSREHVMMIQSVHDILERVKFGYVAVPLCCEHKEVGTRGTTKSKSQWDPGSLI